MLDRLNEQVSKKADQEYIRTSLAQTKTELLQQIDIAKNELNLERNQRESKVLDQIEKVDMNGEKALDEIYTFKEQLRLLQEERKRDIEETADFIKQLMDT